jgi:hypothetical protein
MVLCQCSVRSGLYKPTSKPSTTRDAANHYGRPLRDVVKKGISSVLNAAVAVEQSPGRISAMAIMLWTYLKTPNVYRFSCWQSQAIRPGKNCWLW